MMKYIADCSLSLINRTGAHYVVREIIEGLPDHFAAIRHWRFYGEGPGHQLTRKICGRLMLLELELMKGSEHFRWPLPKEHRDLPVLYMDPLYVLRNQLRERDIVLCHDVGPLSTPEFFDPNVSRLYSLAYDRINQVRPGIVFVSHSSCTAYRDFVGTEARFMTVIPLFTRERVGPGNSAQERVEGLVSPFFICVAASEKRKNIPTALRAFRRSGLAEKGYSFVVCGPRGNDHEAVDAEIARTPKAVMLGYVSDAQLRWLYTNATSFVLPSLLEGFGMPALEAVEHGLLPIVSAGGALEEATGGVGIFIDPRSEDEIAEAMRTAASEADRPILAKHRPHTPVMYREEWATVLNAG